ncbi:MAG: exodeoxyribonuclease V subunit alpha [Terrimicrobiaceae bacterium]
MGDSKSILLVAALLSRNIRLGHTCLNLHAGLPPIEEPPNDLAAFWESLSVEELARCSAVGSPTDLRPLILTPDGLLYLRRYWEYEETLASKILSRCPGPNTPVPASEDRQIDAVRAAAGGKFLVISGGPGTGKTTTIFRILENLLQSPHPPKNLVLCAPTGKAAARLQESISQQSTNSPLADRLPRTASTLHRLLGPVRGSNRFHHHAANPLPADLVVIDEASMVPLALMAKLFAALSPHARVILVGDADQLTSVEAGSVLGDLVAAASQPTSPLHAAVVVLEKNYRFGNNSPIHRLSSAIRKGRVQVALSLLRNPIQSVGRESLSSSPTPSPRELEQALQQEVLNGFAPALREADARLALEALRRFRILTPLRHGPYGVAHLNLLAEKILREAGLMPSLGRHRRGTPLIIQENDYSNQLFNGDVGIILPGPEGEPTACFPGIDGKIRRFSPERLPRHESAFAMTIHKSQGSEFESVLVIFPPHDSPLLTRELAYTAITRASRAVGLWYQPELLGASISRKIQRDSGLINRLTSSTPPPVAGECDS